MKTFASLVFASLILAAAVQLFAQTKNWQDAKVTDISETVVSVAAWGDTNIRHYKIETESTAYVLDYAFNPAVKVPWPKQHSRNRAPDLTVNLGTKIAVDGHDAYVLDSTGREVKMPISSKTAKQ